ncbi:uncharacterized protein LOC128255499 [Drosophila gunungcola]|uniref:NADH-ubiquinone oxidoreductase 9 kDa subunit n=1 Tax=Drosophila gunungcola TaxID=103775 RepID=A0A9P9YIV9_9MUSC|nr:uncharacterized protein LOC128255499 [Drosophila gunungcola]KAI8037558.1 hypothetical protein M5D96_009711 [Drosophila gunungcola]
MLCGARIRPQHLPRPPLWRLRIIRGYSKNGKKNEDPNVLNRLGTSPRNIRDHPEGCTPQSLKTTAFISPDFIPPSTYRIVEEEEQLGPKAAKNETYKNPEYFSYYRYSYYDLKTIVDTIKKKQASKN